MKKPGLKYFLIFFLLLVIFTNSPATAKSSQEYSKVNLVYIPEYYQDNSSASTIDSTKIKNPYRIEEMEKKVSTNNYFKLEISWKEINYLWFILYFVF